MGKKKQTAKNNKKDQKKSREPGRLKTDQQKITTATDRIRKILENYEKRKNETPETIYEQRAMEFDIQEFEKWAGREILKVMVEIKKNETPSSKVDLTNLAILLTIPKPIKDDIFRRLGIKTWDDFYENRFKFYTGSAQKRISKKIKEHIEYTDHRGNLRNEDTKSLQKRSQMDRAVVQKHWDKKVSLLVSEYEQRKKRIPKWNQYNNPVIEAFGPEYANKILYQLVLNQYREDNPTYVKMAMKRNLKCLQNLPYDLREIICKRLEIEPRENPMFQKNNLTLEHAKKLHDAIEKHAKKHAKEYDFGAVYDEAKGLRIPVTRHPKKLPIIKTKRKDEIEKFMLNLKDTKHLLMNHKVQKNMDKNVDAILKRHKEGRLPPEEAVTEILKLIILNKMNHQNTLLATRSERNLKVVQNLPDDMKKLFCKELGIHMKDKMLKNMNWTSRKEFDLKLEEYIGITNSQNKNFMTPSFNLSTKNKMLRMDDDDREEHIKKSRNKIVQNYNHKNLTPQEAAKKIITLMKDNKKADENRSFDAKTSSRTNWELLQSLNKEEKIQKEILKEFGIEPFFYGSPYDKILDKDRSEQQKWLEKMLEKHTQAHTNEEMSSKPRKPRY